MNIEIISIGGLKEPWLREAEKEYSKRLSSYVKLSIVELNEKRLPPGAGEAEEEIVRKGEGEALLARAGKTGNKDRTGNTFVYALDPRGKQMTSEEFSKDIAGLALQGKSNLIFLIGGSLGLPETVRQKADRVLSFSEMTFPYQLMRIILLEQIYRAWKIQRGETYHK